MIGWFARTLARLAALFRGRRLDEAVEQDLSAHLELLSDDLVARGVDPAEARREARLRMGSVASGIDAHRTARSFRWLDDARRDVGYAIRTLGRAPGFTAAAIATLALGIGGVTLMYSVIHHVLVAPYPYRDADRIVDVRVRTDRGGMHWNFRANEFLDYLEQSDVFERVVGIDDGEAHLIADGIAENVEVVGATSEVFTFLGVQAARGRSFGPPDVQPGAPPVAVLNHRTWTTLFGADPAIVGRTVRLDEDLRTIVGIMPPRFEWQDGDFWIPLPDPVRTAPGARSAGTFAFYGRLKPGVTTEAAGAQLTALVRRRVSLFPDEYRQFKTPNFYADVQTLVDRTVGNFRGVLYTLFGAVALLLCIACGNAANMLLARASAREREMAIRAALGAGRGRLVRQLLVESLLLSLGGIATGTVLAALGSQRLQDWMRVLDVPAEAQLRLDVPVLVFAFAAGLLATLAFGLYPALHGARRHSLTGVADSGRSTAGRRHGRVRGTLVVAQVGLALLLVLGASLLIRSFLHRLDFDLGFDHRRVFATRFEYRPGLSRTPANLQRFYREVLDRVARVPGVQGAAMSSSLPGFFARQSSPLGVSRAMSGEPPLAVLTFCSEGILDALGFRLVAGRSLTRSDVDASRKVVLVNETFAHRYFDTENPLGQWIRVDRLATQRPAVPDPIFQIVGVVEDIANSGITDPPGPEVYLPYSIPGVGAQWLFVRSTTAPERLLALVREQVHSVDPTVALEEPGPFQSQHPGWPVTDEHRFSLLVLAAFAITGLGLVALGVYGVIAYTVSQQTREFAIRLALGGERRQVGAQVLRTTFWLVGAGTLIGLGASFATGRVLATQLYQTSPRDPITLAAAVAVILLTGAVACIVPARRAMRVEPAVALRHDE